MKASEFGGRPSKASKALQYSCTDAVNSEKMYLERIQFFSASSHLQYLVSVQFTFGWIKRIFLEDGGIHVRSKH